MIHKPSCSEQEGSLLGEDSFRQLLALEKKRSERSRNPAMLMLLSVKEPCDHSAARNLLSRLGTALFAVTRETDIKGWYADHIILGVVYTEIGNADLQDARDSIYQKVDGYLRDILTAEQRQQVEISFDSCLAVKPQHMSQGARPDLRLYHGNALATSSARKHVCLLTSFMRHRGILVIGDITLVAMVCFFGTWLRQGTPLNIFADAPRSALATIAQVMLGLFIFDQYNARHLTRWRETFARTVLTVLLAAFGGAVIAFLAPQWQPSHRLFALEAVVLCVLLATFRVLYARLFLAAETRAPALVLGNGNLGKHVCQLLSTPFSPFDVRGCLVDGYSAESPGGGVSGIIGSADQIGQTAAELGIRTLIVALPRQRSLHMVRRILEARLSGMEVIDMPDLYERITGRIPVQHIEDQWLLFANGFSLLSKTAVQRLKRLIDLISAGLILLITLPVGAVVAIAIRLDSLGPVFYQEERIGKKGHPFRVWTFRTMHAPGEEDGNESARPTDARVTRVGRWLRLLHIDQLPQIWNVFKGDLSLVGPSPVRPELAHELNRQIPYYSVRHTVSPGITGWAHIKYPYGASFEDALCRLEYDLYYIKNMSLLLDLKILARTISMALLREAPR